MTFLKDQLGDTECCGRTEQTGQNGNCCDHRGLKHEKQHESEQQNHTDNQRRL